MISGEEELLSWLQNFYSIKKNISGFKLPEYLSDNSISPYTCFEDIKSTSGVLKIYNVSNPGWQLEFYYKNILYQEKPWTDININIGINLIEEGSNDWFSAEKQKNKFGSGGGPLYLSICLEAFRFFIQKKKLAITDLTNFKKKLKKNNSLLCWLEQLYFSCCDSDWEHTYGYSLVSTKTGWLMVLSVAEWDFGNKPFQKIVIQEEDGIVECYKLDSQFIIRAHFGELITGLLKFRDWVEG